MLTIRTCNGTITLGMGIFSHCGIVLIIIEYFSYKFILNLFSVLILFRVRYFLIQSYKSDRRNTGGRIDNGIISVQIMCRNRSLCHIVGFKSVVVRFFRIVDSLAYIRLNIFYCGKCLCGMTDSHLHVIKDIIFDMKRRICRSLSLYGVLVKNILKSTYINRGICRTVI